MIGHSSRGLLAVVAVVCLLGVSTSQAAILYTSGTYSQDFNTLPTSPTNTNLQAAAPPGPYKWADDGGTATAGFSTITLPGWYLWHSLSATEGGTNDHQRLRIHNGAATTGSFYSVGTTGQADRAMGILGSNVLANTSTTATEISTALRLTNNSSETFTQFTIGYTGEQWRDGGAATPNPQTMTLDYNIGASTFHDNSASEIFTNIAGGNFTSPTFTNTGGGASLDGNAAANRVVFAPITVTGILWYPGTDLWIRWSDPNHAGNDHHLAVDDVSFIAAPEPASLGLLAFAGVGLIRRRRVA